MKKEWDVAIILDACRYDYFEKLHAEYLPKGKLSEARGANETFDWIKNNFKEKYDVTYVSGHPAINSQGVSWGTFDARRYFSKIIDCWLFGWKGGTTDPKVIASSAILAGFKKKTIIHFMQPHTPYRKAPIKKKPKPKDSKLGRVLNRSPEIIRMVYWKLKQHGILKPRQKDYYTSIFTDEEIRELYEDNLKWVLPHVAKVCESAKKAGKKVIITADHGELLGEDGMYWHPPYSNHPVIRKVPYYEVLP